MALFAWNNKLFPWHRWTDKFPPNNEPLQLEADTDVVDNQHIIAKRYERSALTHHEVRGGGKNPETKGRKIFATIVERFSSRGAAN